MSGEIIKFFLDFSQISRKEGEIFDGIFSVGLHFVTWQIMNTPIVLGK